MPGESMSSATADHDTGSHPPPDRPHLDRGMLDGRANRLPKLASGRAQEQCRDRRPKPEMRTSRTRFHREKALPKITRSCTCVKRPPSGRARSPDPVVLRAEIGPPREDRSMGRATGTPIAMVPPSVRCPASPVRRAGRAGRSRPGGRPGCGSRPSSVGSARRRRRAPGAVAVGRSMKVSVSGPRVPSRADPAPAIGMGGAKRGSLDRSGRSGSTRRRWRHLRGRVDLHAGRNLSYGQAQGRQERKTPGTGGGDDRTWRDAPGPIRAGVEDGPLVARTRDRSGVPRRGPTVTRRKKSKTRAEGLASELRTREDGTGWSGPWIEGSQHT
jgi:hypothetical protein